MPTVEYLNRTRCLYCCKDFTTAVAKKNKKFLDAKPTLSWHHFVMRCSQCNSRFCKNCIRKLYGYASREAKQDPLLSQLKTICDNGPYDYVPEVLRFCCLICTKQREYRLAQTPPEQGVHSRLRALVSSGVSLICGFLSNKRRLVITDFHYLGKKLTKQKVSNHLLCPRHTYWDSSNIFAFL